MYLVTIIERALVRELEAESYNKTVDMPIRYEAISIIIQRVTFQHHLPTRTYCTLSERSFSEIRCSMTDVPKLCISTVGWVPWFGS